MRARAALVCGLLAPATAAADVRTMTETYEYSTQPEATTSVQLWHTPRRPDWDGAFPEQFEHRIEIEHGVTEHLDLGTSTVLIQSGRGAMLLDRVTVSAKYRFVDRAEWPVDLLLMLEAGKVADLSNFPVELRAVLARDFDRLTIAVNGIGMVHLGRDIEDGERTDVGWAAGATYQVHPKVRIGAETWGDTADEGPRPPSDKVHASVGPVVHVAPTAKLWATATAGFGLTETSDDLQVRVILGIEL